MRTGGLSEDEYLDLARLEEFAIRLEGREAAVVLSAIDFNPGRFAGRERGTIVVNIDGEGAYEYVFMRARSGEILFLEKTWVSE